VLLENKVILVTGAGRGIGAGVAAAIAEEGGDVVATDLTRDAVTDTVRRIEATGRSAHAIAMDVTDEEAVTRAVEATLATFDRLDGLVNNAGLLLMNPVLETDRETWQRQFEVNVYGLVSCCQVAARAMMKSGGGSIVNIASNAGKVGYPNMAGYNAAKAAVISVTRSLATEWAEHGINVNAVCPGGVATPMLEEVADWVGDRIGEEPEELLATMVPAQLGRHVEPVEVGRVVAFLLSNQATVIRGQAINVDGGDTPY